MTTIATEEMVVTLAGYLQKAIPKHAEERAYRLVKAELEATGKAGLPQVEIESRAAIHLKHCPAWTSAVHDALAGLTHVHQTWKLFPDEKPFKGEYLCDFVLHEENYGTRIACESQWDHGTKHQGELKWAFDKLRGVKADIKLFIYEGSLCMGEAVMCPLLEGLTQLSPDEAFLALRWTENAFEASWWMPEVKGKPSSVVFSEI